MASVVASGDAASDTPSSKKFPTTPTPIEPEEPVASSSDDDSEDGDPSTHPSNRAKAKALSIPEILEQILLNLRICDLIFPIPLVCRQWRDTIEGSSKLQQALFLSPLPGGPLYLSSHPSLRPKWIAHENDRHTHIISVNPFYTRFLGYCAGRVRREDLRKFARPEASWRGMLVCQPPVAERVFERGSVVRAGDAVLRCGDGGLRLDSRELLRERERGEFWLKAFRSDVGRHFTSRSVNIFKDGFGLAGVGGNSQWKKVERAFEVLRSAWKHIAAAKKEFMSYAIRCCGSEGIQSLTRPYKHLPQCMKAIRHIPPPLLTYPITQHLTCQQNHPRKPQSIPIPPLTTKQRKKAPAEHSTPSNRGQKREQRRSEVQIEAPHQTAKLSPTSQPSACRLAKARGKLPHHLTLSHTNDREEVQRYNDTWKRRYSSHTCITVPLSYTRPSLLYWCPLSTPGQTVYLIKNLHRQTASPHEACQPPAPSTSPITQTPHLPHEFGIY
ncbi:hypothetical protein M409DRAFT_54807 [Zasmidium cellare ATCC 36951]|uniref:F-box domain-containing protein n=1 Tax=Zasmidium cellare ATCC 36951 TaxID=1080233 RepID=A0A6A6CHD5_ZASCE|nr:uncharacterized protein M409DRAFT_54807 [Zasmidium cellare ATCC 36951]KAF2166461.1 hypothetical protein M409DRAFT_54807 [Zasmidium cellare ATCC 36951]